MKNYFLILILILLIKRHQCFILITLREYFGLRDIESLWDILLPKSFSQATTMNENFMARNNKIPPAFDSVSSEISMEKKVNEKKKEKLLLLTYSGIKKSFV